MDSRSKQLIGFFSIGILVLLGLVFSEVCKSKDKGDLKIIPLSTFYSIFGEAEDTTSGVIDVGQTDNGILISYHFYVEDLSDFEREIGLDLAPKIKEFYKKIEEADKVDFTIYVPQMDESLWRPYVSFEVTRKLIDETDWTRFLDTELLEVVLNVKYYE
jgi:hypothetical protein